jgi:hypothetical protein
MKMKRTLFAAAVAFALASGSAAGQGVKMTDEQLDQVTAAGAKSLILIINPGKANVAHNMNFASGNHATCINCLAMPTADGKTGGLLALQNRKYTIDNTLIRCVGAGVAGFC